MINIPRTEYPIELILDWDSGTVTFSHGTDHGAGVYSYNINELDPAILDQLLGPTDEVVVYTQGESFTKEEFEDMYGMPLTMANLQRVHDAGEE